MRNPPPPPCAPTPRRPRSPSPTTLTPRGLRCVCGSSAPGSLATDCGGGFDFGWGPGSSYVFGCARSSGPRWFATSHRARSGLPRLGPLLPPPPPPPPPVARGEGGDTGRGGGKGGGEAEALAWTSGEGRRAVLPVRGPGLPRGAGRGRCGSPPGSEAGERSPGLRGRKGGRAACGRSRRGSPPGLGAFFLTGLFPTWHTRGPGRPRPGRGLIGVSPWSCLAPVNPGFRDSTFPPFGSACGRKPVLHFGRECPQLRVWQPRKFEDRPQNFSVCWGGGVTGEGQTPDPCPAWRITPPPQFSSSRAGLMS